MQSRVCGIPLILLASVYSFWGSGFVYFSYPSSYTRSAFDEQFWPNSRPEMKNNNIFELKKIVFNPNVENFDNLLKILGEVNKDYTVSNEELAFTVNSRIDERTRAEGFVKSFPFKTLLGNFCATWLLQQLITITTGQEAHQYWFSITEIPDVGLLVRYRRWYLLIGLIIKS